MKIDNKTRWGSAYKMIKRLLASRAAISATLAIVTGTRKKPPVDLTSAEWKTLENLEEVLRPLHEATKFVSKEKYPIISSGSPLFRRIFDLHLLASESDDEISKNFKEVIKADLMKRWGSLLDDMPDAFVLAVCLDVRLKDFSFVSDENQEFVGGEGSSSSSRSSSSHEHEKRLALLFGEDLAKTTASLREESLDELEVYHDLRPIPFAVDRKVVLLHGVCLVSECSRRMGFY